MELKLFTITGFSALEIVSFSEFMKSKQKHSHKAFSAVFDFPEKILLLPNRLEEGARIKEEQIIKQARSLGLKFLRRLTYGTNWELYPGYKYFSFVFDIHIDWKEMLNKLIKQLVNVNVSITNGNIIAGDKELGGYGTYSDAINTTVEFYLKQNINFEEIKGAVHTFFEIEGYEVEESTKLSIYDKNFLTSIVNGKYSTQSWILDSQPPFLEGKCLIELLVAYPPTRYCKQFIELTKRAIVDLKVEDKIELVIYERGKKGQILKNMISTGILTAFKSHRIPALVVNGDLKASKTVPTLETIKSAIIEELQKLNLIKS